MTRQRREIKLAGVPLENCHVCAFFNSSDEFYEVLSPFIREGLQEGDKAFHIVDPAHREQHLARLQDSGISTETVVQTGQLEVIGWYDAYLRDGRFDPDRMLALVEEVLDRGHDQGYSVTCAIANMEWAFEGCPGVESIIEYESRLNYLLPNYDDPVICTYDCSRFGGRLVMDVLRTHPMVLIGGMVQKNPFYVPPDEFLKELRGRPQKSAAA
jgi:hypothetical protein